MAILLRRVCDVCQENNETADGETITVTIDGVTRIVEFCADHRQEYVASVEDWLLEYGRPDGSPAPSPKGGRPRAVVPAGTGVTCPLCGVMIRSRSLLSPHVRNRHDTSITQLVEQGKLPFLRRGREARPR